MISNIVGTRPAGYAEYMATDVSLEVLLMAVNLRRAEMMEVQLQGQMHIVQSNNDRVAFYNAVQTGLQKLLGEFAPDAKATATLSGKAAKVEQYNTQLRQDYEVLVQAQARAQRALSPDDDALRNPADQRYVQPSMAQSGWTHAQQNIVKTRWDATAASTKGDLQALLTEVKGETDAVSNTQQMDQLRLQTLSNRRNESFDLVTGFIKKESDNKSGIVRNIG